MEGALMMNEENSGDCGDAMSRPVLTIGKRLCLTWNVKENFARDQITAFQNNNIEVNVTMHYLSSGTTIINHGVESGWKTIDLDKLFFLELAKDSNAPDFLPLLTDEAVIVDFGIDVNQMERDNPVPILMFFKVSVVTDRIEMFASSPLVAFISKPDASNDAMTTKQCNSIIPKLDKVLVNRVPCPATMSQAFLDPSLVVDSGCIVNPANPNKAFNCHLNPDAMQCFLQR